MSKEFTTEASSAVVTVVVRWLTLMKKPHGDLKRPAQAGKRTIQNLSRKISVAHLDRV